MTLEYALWLKNYTDEHLDCIYHDIAFIAKEMIKINKRLDKLEKQSNNMPIERF